MNSATFLDSVAVKLGLQRVPAAAPSGPSRISSASEWLAVVRGLDEGCKDRLVVDKFRQAAFTVAMHLHTEQSWETAPVTIEAIQDLGDTLGTQCVIRGAVIGGRGAPRPAAAKLPPPPPLSPAGIVLPDVHPLAPPRETVKAPPLPNPVNVRMNATVQRYADGIATKLNLSRAPEPRNSTSAASSGSVWLSSILGVALSLEESPKRQEDYLAAAFTVAINFAGGSDWMSAPIALDAVLNFHSGQGSRVIQSPMMGGRSHLGTAAHQQHLAPVVVAPVAASKPPASATVKEQLAASPYAKFLDPTLLDPAPPRHDPGPPSIPSSGGRVPFSAGHGDISEAPEYGIPEYLVNSSRAPPQQRPPSPHYAHGTAHAADTRPPYRDGRADSWPPRARSPLTFGASRPAPPPPQQHYQPQPPPRHGPSRPDLFARYTAALRGVRLFPEDVNAVLRAESLPLLGPQEEDLLVRSVQYLKSELPSQFQEAFELFTVDRLALLHLGIASTPAEVDMVMDPAFDTVATSAVGRMIPHDTFAAPPPRRSLPRASAAPAHHEPPPPSSSSSAFNYERLAGVPPAHADPRYDVPPPATRSPEPRPPPSAVDRFVSTAPVHHHPMTMLPTPSAHVLHTGFPEGSVGWFRMKLAFEVPKIETPISTDIEGWLRRCEVERNNYPDREFQTKHLEWTVSELAQNLRRCDKGERINWSKMPIKRPGQALQATPTAALQIKMLVPSLNTMKQTKPVVPPSTAAPKTAPALAPVPQYPAKYVTQVKIPPKPTSGSTFAPGTAAAATKPAAAAAVAPGTSAFKAQTRAPPMKASTTTTTATTATASKRSHKKKKVMSQSSPSTSSSSSSDGDDDGSSSSASSDDDMPLAKLSQTTGKTKQKPTTADARVKKAQIPTPAKAASAAPPSAPQPAASPSLPAVVAADVPSRGPSATSIVGIVHAVTLPSTSPAVKPEDSKSDAPPPPPPAEVVVPPSPARPAAAATTAAKKAARKKREKSVEPVEPPRRLVPRPQSLIVSSAIYHVVTQQHKRKWPEDLKDIGRFMAPELIPYYKALCLGHDVLVVIAHVKEEYLISGRGVVSHRPEFGRVSVKYSIIDGRDVDRVFDLPATTAFTLLDLRLAGRGQLWSRSQAVEPFIGPYKWEDDECPAELIAQFGASPPRGGETQVTTIKIETEEPIHADADNEVCEVTLLTDALEEHGVKGESVSAVIQVPDSEPPHEAPPADSHDRVVDDDDAGSDDDKAGVQDATPNPEDPDDISDAPGPTPAALTGGITFITTSEQSTKVNEDEEEEKRDAASAPPDASEEQPGNDRDPDAVSGGEEEEAAAYRDPDGVSNGEGHDPDDVSQADEQQVGEEAAPFLAAPPESRDDDDVADFTNALNDVANSAADFDPSSDGDSVQQADAIVQDEPRESIENAEASAEGQQNDDDADSVSIDSASTAMALGEEQGSADVPPLAGSEAPDGLVYASDASDSDDVSDAVVEIF